MKKNLRLLFLGLAAATFTCGFAQEDKTFLLKNADMEQGLKGWAFDGEHVGKNTKDPAARIGFHGMNKGVLEAWHGDRTPLGDSYVMQKVNELPNGTYVFGAYAGASLQGTTWSNRDSIDGVFLFANDAKVKVATDNPDMAYKYKWAHSSKFNVATKVTDGSLLVGLKVEKTNANYIVWDNATLYYFGDMSEAEALDAMAQIDMDIAIENSDTLLAVDKNIKIETDTVWALMDAIDVAKSITVTTANFWEESEALLHVAGLARRSAADYAGLKKDIDWAKVVYNGVWTETGKTRFYYIPLGTTIKTAQEAYDAAYFNEGRTALTNLRTELTRYANWLRVDSFNVARDAVNNFRNTAKFTGAPGEYSAVQQAQLTALYDQMGDTLNAVINLNTQDKTKAKPETLYPFIAQAYALIEKVKNNPIPLEYTKMPVAFNQSKEKVDGYAYAEGAFKNSNGLIELNSPVYRFTNYVKELVITVPRSAVGNTYFCLSELAFYDASGNKIDLKEENIKTDYDHNAINPKETDGQGIKGLVDGKTDTYFHSAWKNIPTGEHSLKVTLPGDGYNSFSFVMIARPGQNWQFPASITINLPTPKRDAMKVQLQKAKDKAAYIGTDPGFFKGLENAEVFAELNNAITAAETLIANNGAEDEMPAIEERLKQAVFQYENQLENEYKEYNLPDPTKKYRLISAFPGFLEKQQVEKAITLHAADTTLWWSDVTADALEQEFMFEPYLDEENFVHSVQDGDNVDKFIYSYKLKHVKTGLYVDSAFVGDPKTLKLTKVPSDTVKLKTLGRGQWSIMVKGSQLHCGDHNSGNAGTGKGAYGGTWGISSRLVPYPGGLDGCSAWFIREIPAMPYEVAVTSGNFKSAAIHFAATNQITLTADADCAFEDLVLYDLYGAPVACDIVVEGAVATVSTESVIASCIFAFNNKEAVSKVTFGVLAIVKEEADLMAALEEKFEKVSAYAPEQGTAVGQYDDITEYLDAIDVAEGIIESGSETDEVIESAIAQLDSAVAHLKNPHLPEAGKYYFIVSGLSAFEKNLGYNMAIYPNDKELRWKHENILDSALCWQFEPATVAELYETLDSAKVKENISVEGKDTIVKAFYIKNFSTGEYVNARVSDNNRVIALASKKAAASLYKVTMLNSGTAIALDNVEGGRLHAEGHNSGNGKSGIIVYYNAGAESASAWRIVETENDFVVNTEIDLVEVEPVKVVKGIYDLFGRRLDAPAAPGIYIIDGVKRVIK